MPPRARLHALSLALVALAATGCDDLASFTTQPGEAYCGAVTLGSAFRQGLSPRVQMRLTVDASQLDGPGTPGVVSTFEPSDGVLPEVRLLDDADLRVIAPLEHDPLSRLDFGDGRERNAIYAASPADPTQESFMVVLSLVHDGSAEIRLLRAGRPPPSGAASPAGQTAIFGLFPLTKLTSDCGF
jgi:hypothetical protein